MLLWYLVVTDTTDHKSMELWVHTLVCKVWVSHHVCTMPVLNHSREGCARFGPSHTKSGHDPVTPRAPVVLSCALSTLQKKSRTAAWPARVHYAPWWPILTRGAFFHCLLKKAGVGSETIEQSFPKEGCESDTTGRFTSGKRSRTAAIKSLFLQLRSIPGL